MDNDKITQTLFLLLENGEGANGKALASILDYLGTKNFIKLIDVVGGKTLKIPTRKELESYLMLAYCYQYRQMGKSWNEIRASLGENGKLLNMKSMGKSMLRLTASLRKGVARTLLEGGKNDAE